jgi:hypothetical protein
MINWHFNHHEMPVLQLLLILGGAGRYWKATLSAFRRRLSQARVSRAVQPPVSKMVNAWPVSRWATVPQPGAQPGHQSTPLAGGSLHLKRR